MAYQYFTPWTYPFYRAYNQNSHEKGHSDYCCMEKGTITVSGEGSIKVPPNKAAVVLGTLTRSSILNEALDENNKITENVINALIRLGMEKKNIRTQDFYVNPIFSDKEDKTQVIEGYEVINTIEADIPEIGLVGKVIDTGISAGANKVNSIRFYNDDPLVRESALKKAVREAEHKARVIAGELSLKITGIKSASGGWNNVRPFYQAMSAKAETAVPISPGEIEVTSNVSISYYVE